MVVIPVFCFIEYFCYSERCPWRHRLKTRVMCCAGVKKSKNAFILERKIFFQLTDESL